MQRFASAITNKIKAELELQKLKGQIKTEGKQLSAKQSQKPNSSNRTINISQAPKSINVDLKIIESEQSPKKLDATQLTLMPRTQSSNKDSSISPKRHESKSNLNAMEMLKNLNQAGSFNRKASIRKKKRQF